MRLLICLALLALVPPPTWADGLDEDDRASLREVLADPEEPMVLRRKACQALGEARDETSVKALADALGHEGLGYWAAQALWQVGPAGQAAARRRLDDKKASPAARRFATLALGKQGPLVGLQEALTGKDRDGRLWAAGALGALGEEGGARPAEWLTRAARSDADGAVRAEAALALAGLKVSGRQKARLLARALVDRATPAARREALVSAISRLGLDGGFAVPALVGLLKSDKREVALAAAVALGAVCGDGKKAVPALERAAERAVRDGDADLYEAAQGAVEEIQGRAPRPTTERGGR